MVDKSVITNLETRIGQLIDDHRRLSGLCSELTAQCNALRQEKRALEERVKVLDNEVARMQLTEGLAGGSRNKEKARARVNRLMREVDKCIALLGRQTETFAKKNTPREAVEETEMDPTAIAPEK